MNNLAYIVFGFIIFSFLYSCTFDNTEEYYAYLNTDTIEDCGDTLEVSFWTEVFPVIADNCSSCHNDIVSYGGRNYDHYNGIIEVVDNGKLLKVINHTPGYPQMPRDAPKLQQCQIDKIEAWINQGSLNN
jgi:mono/diheme cytochrome c family protein